MKYIYHPLDKVYITQNFGTRPEIYKQFGLNGHNGIDYRTRFIDSPFGKRYVSACEDGVVEEVRWDTRGYGVHVRIRHADKSLSIYGHFTKPYVQKGDVVKAQQIIGLSGSTGFSSAPHLHFEYRLAPIKSRNGYAGAVNTISGQDVIMLATLPKQFFK